MERVLTQHEGHGRRRGELYLSGALWQLSRPRGQAGEQAGEQAGDPEKRRPWPLGSDPVALGG